MSTSSPALEIEGSHRRAETNPIKRLRPTRSWRRLRRRFYSFRHLILFVASILLYLGVPFLEQSRKSILNEDVFTIFLLFSSMLVLSRSGLSRIVCASLSAAIIVANMLEHRVASSYLDMGEGICLALLYAIVLVAVVRDLLRENEVALDHIMGAVAGYFILGFLWGEIYNLLLIIQPRAILASSGSLLSKAQILYFSFSTLVTIGYGDFLPKAGLARSIAVLEGISGQFYLAILIARLVGLHLHHTINPKKRRFIGLPLLANRVDTVGITEHL